MKVSELIEALSQYDGDDDIIIIDHPDVAVTDNPENVCGNFEVDHDGIDKVTILAKEW
jgi:hypothetical protein